MNASLKVIASLTALTVGLLGSALRAQTEMPPPPPPGEGPGGAGHNPQEFFLQMLIEKLSLTQDQQTKVIAVLADEKAAMDALRGSGETDGAAIHEKGWRDHQCPSCSDPRVADE